MIIGQIGLKSTKTDFFNRIGQKPQINFDFRMTGITLLETINVALVSEA